MNDTERFFRNKAQFVRSAHLMGLSDRASKDGDTEGAFRLAAKALSVDPTASKVDWLMLTENPREFVPRRDIFTLVNLRLDDLRERASSTASGQSVSTRPSVFVYWGQGFSSAPPIVQKCFARAESVVSSQDLVALDDSNIGDWIDIPEVIESCRSKSYAAYSDYIRFALLSRYGGIWLDATCYCMSNPLDYFDELVGSSGFFAFDKKQPGVISRWFLASASNNYIAEINRLAQVLYWSVFDDVITYFFAHQIFRTIYRLDTSFANLWDDRFRYSGNPRLVHRSLKVRVSDNDFESRLNSSFVHKLTYKLEPESLECDSGYHRVMSI